jgi:hypothetical protein
MKVLSYDGRYWVETSFQHGAIQTRVVREGYPKRHSATCIANENVHLPMELMNEGLHVVEFKVHNRMAGSLTGRVKSGLLTLLLAYLVYHGAFLLPWYVIGVLGLGAAYLGKIILRGGIGNTGVAKQLAGVTSPFVLTPYMLVRHVEGKKELMQQEQ